MCGRGGLSVLYVITSFTDSSVSAGLYTGELGLGNALSCVELGVQEMPRAL